MCVTFPTTTSCNNLVATGLLKKNDSFQEISGYRYDISLPVNNPRKIRSQNNVRQVKPHGSRNCANGCATKYLVNRVKLQIYSRNMKE